DRGGGGDVSRLPPAGHGASRLPRRRRLDPVAGAEPRRAHPGAAAGRRHARRGDRRGTPRRRRALAPGRRRTRRAGPGWLRERRRGRAGRVGARGAPGRAAWLMAERARVDITSIAAGGDGVARVDGLVVFVPRTAPGDVAEI